MKKAFDALLIALGVLLAPVLSANTADPPDGVAATVSHDAKAVGDVLGARAVEALIREYGGGGMNKRLAALLIALGAYGAACGGLYHGTPLFVSLLYFIA